MLLQATLFILLLTLLLILVGALRGPSLYDRVLALNMFGTKAVLLIAVGGQLLGWTSYADVALLYALINYVGTIAVLRFVEASLPNDKEPHP